MPEKDDSNKTWWRPAMELFAQVSGWIVIPIIAALFLGRYMDDKFGTAPRYLLICIGFAFIVTMVGLVRQTLIAVRKIEKEAKEDKKKESAEK